LSAGTRPAHRGTASPAGPGGHPRSEHYPGRPVGPGGATSRRKYLARHRPHRSLERHTMTQDAAVCIRCGTAPRLPKQRWCRSFLTAYKIVRYWRLRAAEADPAEAVTPAPVLAARPLVLCARCGYSQWREHTPGTWVCGLCGVPKTITY